MNYHVEDDKSNETVETANILLQSEVAVIVSFHQFFDRTKIILLKLKCNLHKTNAERTFVPFYPTRIVDDIVTGRVLNVIPQSNHLRSMKKVNINLQM